MCVTRNKSTKRKPQGIKRRLGWFLMDRANCHNPSSRLGWWINTAVWDSGFKLYYKKAAD